MTEHYRRQGDSLSHSCPAPTPKMCVCPTPCIDKSKCPGHRACHNEGSE